MGYKHHTRVCSVVRAFASWPVRFPGWVKPRPRFDSLAESKQNTLKVGIHSFHAWRSAIKRVSVEIGRQVRLAYLLCPWAST